MQTQVGKKEVKDLNQVKLSLHFKVEKVAKVRSIRWSQTNYQTSNQSKHNKNLKSSIRLTLKF